MFQAVRIDGVYMDPKGRKMTGPSQQSNDPYSTYFQGGAVVLSGFAELAVCF